MNTQRSMLTLGIFLLMLATGSAQDLERSVIKIYTTAAPVSLLEPWQRSGTYDATGTGFVITGNRIVTNAHVVDFATFIQVKKEGETRRFDARVVHVSHQADLAMLDVKDPSFYDGLVPLELGELPAIQDRITIVGYPKGGEDISFTSGIVSHIEVRNYVHSREDFLAMQVDAAINPGNSGGPGVSDGKVAGVVMQGASDAQNVGYLIPVTLLRHFLTDIEDGKVDGFPTPPFVFESLTNEMIREYYGLDARGNDGVLIYNTDEAPIGSAGLQREDIILSINGKRITSNGRFEYRPGLLVALSGLVADLQVGAPITYRVIRNKKELTETERAVIVPRVVHLVHHAEEPAYCIFGGLVFGPLNQAVFNYDSDVDGFLQVYDDVCWRRNKGEIVLLQGILSHSVNAGYWYPDIVASVNGEQVVDLADFAAKVKKADRWVKLVMDRGSIIILDKNRTDTAEAEIREIYRIR